MVLDLTVLKLLRKNIHEKIKAQLPNEDKEPGDCRTLFTEHDTDIENESDEVRLLG